ncbi:MAG: hypothetical protein IJ901_11070 [Bacteroidaceae bacterium]|nr:hypothetical protein [Bacteroidaceae bacterium]
MKKTLLSMLMMGSALMANAQQTINVEFLNGDMDDDDQITVNDVTNLIGAYLEGTTPIKSITVDNTEVMDKMDYLFNWNYKQDDAIAVISDKITTNSAAIANNSAAIANNSYKIANNSTYIKQNVEDIKKNSDDIKELQRNITALAGVISKMEADNAMMQVMIDSQENDITDLKNKNAQLQETVEILETQNRELQTAIANINNFVDELNRRIANLERQINQ